jgi:hypothetical protein
LNHERLNTGNCKKYGIAFGEAVLMSSPPSRSQICGQARRQSFAESGFGGWAVPWTLRWDEKIKTAREAAPRLDRKKSQRQHFTISPVEYEYVDKAKRGTNVIIYRNL